MAIPYIQSLLPLPLRAHTHTGWARRNEKWGAEFTTNMSKETCIYFTTNITWRYTIRRDPYSTPPLLSPYEHAHTHRLSAKKWKKRCECCGAVRAQVQWKCNTFATHYALFCIFEVPHMWSATLCNTLRRVAQCGLRYIGSATRCNTLHTLFLFLKCNTFEVQHSATHRELQGSAGSGTLEVPHAATHHALFFLFFKCNAFEVQHSATQCALRCGAVRAQVCLKSDQSC